MVALRSLLSRAELGLVPVVDNRADDLVRWVATSDLADPCPYLEGGEVLLATGLNTAEWDGEWSEYVARLARAGVVAIGLGVGLTHPRSPEMLVAACRQWSVDLFEVPKPTRFVAVSRALAALLQEEEEATAQTVLEAQRTLMRAALREHEPRVLLEAVARIGVGAVVLDPAGRAVAGPLGEGSDEIDLTVVAEEISRIRRRGMRVATSVNDPMIQLLIHPLGVKGWPRRYLAVAFKGRAGEAQRSMLITAVALMSLAEERRREGQETSRALRGRAIELLLEGDLKTATILLAAGRGTPLHPAAPVEVLRCAGTEQQRSEGVETFEAADVLAGLGVAAADEEIVVIAPATQAHAVAARAVDVGMRVGLGGQVVLRDVGTSFVNAGHALASTSSERPTVHWDDSVRHGVLGLLETSRATAFASSLLEPLRGDKELLATLESFLRNHGSQRRTALDVGVHRNTLRTRIARIERVLARSLADPQTRVDCWVALRSLPANR